MEKDEGVNQLIKPLSTIQIKSTRAYSNVTADQRNIFIKVVKNVDQKMNSKMKNHTTEEQFGTVPEKPWTFCETPEDKCTMNYCDENGCQNRKRHLVEPAILEDRKSKVSTFILNKIDKQLEILKDMEAARIEGILTGLKICKEMWAQGTISHENIQEEIYHYQEELENLKSNK